MTTEKPTQPARLAARLVRNAVFNTAEWAIAIVLSILATPFMVRKLTEEGFGTYVVFTSLTGYSALLDLGIGQSLVKLVAQFRATDNQEEISQVINAALCVQLASGILVCLLIILGADTILRWLSIPPSLWHAAKHGLLATAVAFLFVVLSGTLSSALMGLQRYDITSRVNSASNIVLTTTLIMILLGGGGLASLIYATAISWVVLFVIYFRLARKLLPGWKMSLKVPAKLVARMFDLGFFMFVARVSQSFVIYFMRFILSAMLGPAAVTFYSVPFRIIIAFGGFLTTASISLFPLASELEAQGATERLRNVYLRASRYFVSLALPVFSVMGLLSRPILELWMGPAFADKAAGTMAILCFGAALGSTGALSGMVLLGLGRSRLLAGFSLASMAIGALVGISLVPQMGVVGAAIAYAAAGFVWLVFQCYVAQAIFGLRLGEYFGLVYRFHVFALVPLISATILCRSLLLDFEVSASLLAGMSLLAVYYAASLFLKWLDWRELRGLMTLKT